MNVHGTKFTIAEYCKQMADGTILVNTEYQRSPDVWPAAARSYLIDTILNRFPLPKIALFQRTDLATRTTIKEIIDGQQRSTAIRAFLEDRLRISGPSEYSGKRFSDLPVEDRQRYLEYSLDVDVFVSATESDIRQMFRRMNSYNVPLNDEEKRHATHQGPFKWFIVELSQSYDTALAGLGLFTKNQLSRMADAKFLTELSLTYEDGIQTQAPAKLDAIYEQYDSEFPGEKRHRRVTEAALDQLLELDAVHRTALIKREPCFTLVLALAHCSEGVESLEELLGPRARRASKAVLLRNVGKLLEVLAHDSVDDVPRVHRAFYTACDKGTNTKRHRAERLVWLYKALTSRV